MLLSTTTGKVPVFVVAFLFDSLLIDYRRIFKMLTGYFCVDDQKKYTHKRGEKHNKQHNNSKNNMSYQVLCEPLFKKYFGDLPNKFSNKSSALNEALSLSIELDRTFRDQWDRIMQIRSEMQQKIDNGRVDSELVLLPPNTNWKPNNYVKNYDSYADCVLEMTGNALNRMGINAFNYINKMNGEIAKETGDNRPKICWMCCGEDANGAQIESVLENIRHYRDLISGDASVTFGNKEYKLESQDIPPCSFRPRGLHCVEAHVVDKSSGEPIVGPLFDVAFWAQFALPEILAKKNVCPLLYIPKMHVYQEAQLWHQVLKFIEKHFKLEEGTIKTVFLCETFPAVFQLPRMIEAFEGRLIGVNCGRWDYLFSYVQVLANHTKVNVDGKKVNTVLPGKHEVTTDVNLLKKYQIRTAQMCHKYGIMFIGGMNATLPSTHPDPAIRERENHQILETSLKNKSDERQFYHASKTWVAHIGLLQIAKKLAMTPYANPVDKHIRDTVVSRVDLLDAPTYPDQVPKAYNIEAFRRDVHVVLLYMAMYLLNRNGAVAVDNKMEDMATAEISSSLLWFYTKHKILEKEIRENGGIEKMVQDAGKSVKEEILAKHLRNQSVSDQKLQGLLSALQIILIKLIKSQQRPSTLEKVLYILGTRDDPYDQGKALEVMRKSKRFPKAADATFMVSSL
jgi:malate synthase